MALFGATAWLTRAIISQFLARDIERFKSHLSVEHDLAIERIRYDLQLVAKEHEIRFGLLHAKRAEIIAELYQHIVETNDAVETCLDKFKEAPDKRRFDLAKEAIDRSDLLAEYVIRNKIYFSRSLAAELGELYSCLMDTAISYRMHCESLKEGKDCSDFVNMLHGVQVDTEAALRTTEEEFRDLLGVESKSDHADN